MKIIGYIALFGILSSLAVACTPSTSVISNDVVRLNQLGYYPNQEKIAVIDSGKVEEFVILDAVSGKQVFAGKSLYNSTYLPECSRAFIEYLDTLYPNIP